MQERFFPSVHWGINLACYVTDMGNLHSDCQNNLPDRDVQEL